jgi:hypothetical protein
VNVVMDATGDATSDIVSAVDATTAAVTSSYTEAIPSGATANLTDMISAVAAGGSATMPTGAGVVELEALLKALETALSNAVKGIDPHNPTKSEEMGYSAFLKNTGPEYQAWLTKIIAQTKDNLARWAAYGAAQKSASDLAAALMAIQSSMVPGFVNPATGNANVPTIPSSGPRFADTYQPSDPGTLRWPSTLRATINVMLDGRQVGNAQIENLALMGVSM